MAITLTYNSVQVTEQNAVGHTPSDTQELGGRLRLAYGTYETPASTGVTDGESIAMVRIPAGARIVGGKFFADAMGGSATMDVGVAGADGSGYYNAAGTLADDDDFFAAASSVVAAKNEVSFTALIASGSYQFDKEVYIVATAETGNWAADKTLTFIVYYVVD